MEMDEQKRMEHDKMCICGWHVGHRAFRIVLGFIIILLAFWFGVKVGELRGAYGFGGMRFHRGFYGSYYGPMMMYGGYGMPMMQQWAMPQGGMLMPQMTAPQGTK